MYFSIISHIAILTIIIMTVGLHVQDWIWSLPHPYRQGEWCPERNWSFSGSGVSRCSGLAHPKGCQLIFWLCARTVFLIDSSCSGSCSSVTDSGPTALPHVTVPASGSPCLIDQFSRAFLTVTFDPVVPSLPFCSPRGQKSHFLPAALVPWACLSQTSSVQLPATWGRPDTQLGSSEI